MKSELKDLHRAVEINDVRDVIFTDIVENDGAYSRSIRILGEPVENGVKREILEIRISSSNQSDIKFSAPEFDY